MILRKSPENLKKFDRCHAGEGFLWCSEILGEHQRKEPGFNLIHDNVIEPGATIGEHGHFADEEIYVILSGHGIMQIDGEDQPVAAGDVCLTRSGHRHSLRNSPESPMHFLVIGTKI